MEPYRNAVERDMKGKRWQAFMGELAAALDAMPEKALISDELIDGKGGCCALGAVCLARKVDLAQVNCFDSKTVADILGIAPSMAEEIVFMNDECSLLYETPGQRWRRMRAWVTENLSGEANG